MFASRRVYWIAFGALSLLFVLPYWLLQHPPAQDLPGHLALAERIRDPDRFGAYFTVEPFPAPNTFYYYFCGWLGRVIPIEWASKLCLTAAIAGLPAAIGFARRAQGDDDTPALAGFTLALNYNLFAGFIGFVLAMPLLLVMAGLARLHVDAPSWRRGLALAGVGVLVFLCHALLFLFGVGVVGVVVLCNLRREPRWWRRGLLALAPLAAPLAMVVPWYLRISGRPGGLAAKFPTFADNLKNLHVHTFDNLKASWDMWVGCLVLLALAAIACFTRPRLRVAAYGFIAIAAAILYFALPSKIRDEEVINRRMAAIVMIFFAAWVPFRWEGVRRVPLAILGVAIALTVACGVGYAIAAARFADEQAGLRDTLAAAPPGARLDAQDIPRSQIYSLDVYRHVGSYNVVWNGGLTANSFATSAVQPIQVTPEWRMAMRTGNMDVFLTGRPRDLPLLAHVGMFYLYAASAP